ncbi:pentatricopeptide repeat-containing protein At4g08210-like [Papaver somniferum]|uniref:pentatricopeptide repeat-containing protein At4g08210-like n=1 Tax=Papaver somniferum TaxID=3469 RepID=UPI000E6FF2C5|nr:pentatricopeptide repeat-containing protein At4g08210-like [Papaver somniferum]
MDLKHLTLALRHCGKIRAFKHGKAFHCHSIKLGYSQHVFLANNLISMYTDFKLFDSARQLFDEIHERNVVTWTTMINSYISAGNLFEALRMFNLMSEFELETPNPFTFSSALKACSLLGDLEMGKSIHRSIFRGSLQCDTILMNTLLIMYVKCRSLSDAREVFDAILWKNSSSWNTMIDGYAKDGQMGEAVDLFLQMPVRDNVSWNTVIAGFTSLGDSSKALEFVQMMPRHGVHLDQFTFPCALKACSCLNMLTAGKETHCYVVKSDFGLCGWKHVVDFYARHGYVEDALGLFKRLPNKDMVAWTALISVCSQNGSSHLAFSLLGDMIYLNLQVNHFVTSSVLKACSTLAGLGSGKQVHTYCIKCGYESEQITVTSIIDMYLKCGEIEDALTLFSGINERDTICWSGIISGCGHNGRSKEALEYFNEMIKSGVKPNEVTYLGVLCMQTFWFG